jgi:hypothetical protein
MAPAPPEGAPPRHPRHRRRRGGAQSAPRPAASRCTRSCRRRTPSRSAPRARAALSEARAPSRFVAAPAEGRRGLVAPHPRGGGAGRAGRGAAAAARACAVFISGVNVTSCLKTSTSPTAKSAKFVSTTLGLRGHTLGAVSHRPARLLREPRAVRLTRGAYRPREPKSGLGGSGCGGGSAGTTSDGSSKISGELGRSQPPLSASESGGAAHEGPSIPASLGNSGITGRSHPPARGGSGSGSGSGGGSCC